MNPNRITPNLITKLEPGEVFVFGSNLKGIHGAGAAKVAREVFGYPAYWAEGYFDGGKVTHGAWQRSCDCYAVPTCRRPGVPLTLGEIKYYIDRLILFMGLNPQFRFLVTALGCGFAGYKPEQIAPMLSECRELNNVVLPQSFWDVLGA